MLGNSLINNAPWKELFPFLNILNRGISGDVVEGVIDRIDEIADENANKIFREFFPKGTDFRKISQQELNKVQYLINDRPKKKLGFSTPKIEFYKMIH